MLVESSHFKVMSLYFQFRQQWQLTTPFHSFGFLKGFYLFMAIGVTGEYPSPYFIFHKMNHFHETLSHQIFS